MGEEARMSEYEVIGDSNGGDDDERILEWEMGLPNGEDLTPLSQSLIPPELASAFSISPITYKTLVDVNRASQTTLFSIRGSQAHALSSTNCDGVKSFAAAEEREDPMETAEEEDPAVSETTKMRTRKQPECAEEADSSAAMAMMMRTTAAENSNEDPSSAAARTLKRPRLVWTPQLHKRFVDVVAHLGIKNAVPKTIMQLMNVEGLTRENVASHLQKYRLYLKRMQGLSNDDPSPSDHLFASTPVPPHCYETGGNGHNNNNNNNNTNSNGNGNGGHVGVSIPPPPPPRQHHQPMMMSMPVYGMMNQGFHHGHGHGHGFEQNMYNMNMNMGMGMGMNVGMNNMMQQRDWSVNKHYPHHVAPSSTDK